MESLVHGVTFTAPAVKELEALQNDQSLMKLKILLDVRFQCKLCTERNEAEKSLKPEWSDCTKRWVELRQIKEHLRLDHDEDGSVDSSSSDDVPLSKLKHINKSKTQNLGGQREYAHRKTTCRAKKRKQNVTPSLIEHMILDCTEHAEPTTETNCSFSKSDRDPGDSECEDGIGEFEGIVKTDASDMKVKGSDTVSDLSCEDLIAQLMINSTEECDDIQASGSKESHVRLIKIEPADNQINLNYDNEETGDPLLTHDLLKDEIVCAGDGQNEKVPRKYAKKTTHRAKSNRTKSIRSDTKVDDGDVDEEMNSSPGKKESARCRKARTCPGCNTVLDSSAECLKHFVEKHDSLKKFASILDQVKGESESITCSETNKVRCPLCQKPFLEGIFPSHMMLVHVWRPMTRRLTRKKQHLCALCGKVFQYDQNYYNHVRIIHKGEKRKYSPYKPKQFKCTLCDYTTCEQRRLGNHMKYVHSGIKAYSCQHCSYSTWERTSMRDHMYRHLEKKRYSCELCTYQCIQRKQLRGHMMHKHHVDLPKKGKTRLPAKTGPRQTAKPVVEVTNRAVSTDPVRPKKATKRSSKSSQETNQTKRPKVLRVGQETAANVDLSHSLAQSDSWTVGVSQNTDPTPAVSSAQLSYVINNPYQACVETPTKQSHEQFRVVSNIPGSGSSNFVPMTANPMLENHIPNISEMTATSNSNFVVLPTVGTNMAVDNRTVLRPGDQFQIVAQETVEPPVGQFSQGTAIPYPNQAVVPQKTSFQLVPVEQPVAVVSNNLGGELDSLKNKMPNQQFNTVQTSPLFSGVQAQTPMGEAITVTPIYAQTPEASNTLTPNNARGSFVYIIK